MFIYALHACNKCTLFLLIKYVVKSLNSGDIKADLHWTCLGIYVFHV